MTTESGSPRANDTHGSAGAERDPRRPWAPSPFTRLARAHAASVSGDALFAIGLAGSVFFSLDFTSARWRVALYLLLTIAPFAIAAPLIGPAIDRVRGGRRWIIVASIALRAVLAFFVVRHMNTLWFYPEAFGMLVMQKVYSISKSAVVPGTVRSDAELVQANSKLTQLSGIIVVIAAIPGGILYAIGGGTWTVALGAVVFFVGTIFALQLPPTTIAVAPVGEAEREELRSAGITHASSAMGLIRGIVGFLAFMLAFDFKNAGAPLWQLGFVAGTAQLGFFIGALIAPRVRKFAEEERILTWSLVVTIVAGVLTAFIGGLGGAAILSMVVGMTSSAAKQAFDSIVQRDAPDANRGRSFAKFETRFQLLWVIGALLPILIPIPAEVGFALIAVVSSVALISYLVGLRQIRAGKVPQARRMPWQRDTAIDDRHPSARPESEIDRGFASEDTVVPASLMIDPYDHTSHGGVTVPHDARRRWMRPVEQQPPPVPLPFDADGTPVPPGAAVVPATPVNPAAPAVDAAVDGAVDGAVDAVDDVPEHRRRGLLFEPDAWDDTSGD